MEDELAELKAGKIDPEDIKKSKEDLKLYYEGKFSKKEQEYFTQIQDLKNTISDKEKAIRDGVLEKLIEENTRATAEPASMEFVILGLKKLFKYDEEEEKFVSNDGVTPVKEVCEKFLEKNPFFVKSSSGADAKNSKHSKKPTKSWAEMTPTERAIVTEDHPDLAKQLMNA